MQLSIRKKRLLNLLGEPYMIKVIDGEPCVYLDLGAVDIEVSGGSQQNPFNIYVWRGGREIIERYLDLSSKEPFVRVVNILDDIRFRHRAKS